MAIQWVASIATASAGAIVGISGIVATTLTAKGQRQLQAQLLEQQQQHTERTQLRNERRELYARYLELTYRLVEKDHSPEDTRLQLVAYHEIRVLGGDEIVRCAREFDKSVHAIKAEGVEDVGAAADRFLEAEEALINAIRDELGANNGGSLLSQLDYNSFFGDRADNTEDPP